MHRITITPLEKNSLKVGVHDSAKGFLLVSEFIVSSEPGVLSFAPIPPATSFVALEGEIDREMRNAIKAYFAGQNNEQHFSWTAK